MSIGHLKIMRHTIALHLDFSLVGILQIIHITMQVFLQLLLFQKEMYTKNMTRILCQTLKRKVSSQKKFMEEKLQNNSFASFLGMLVPKEKYLQGIGIFCLKKLQLSVLLAIVIYRFLYSSLGIQARNKIDEAIFSAGNS